MFDSTSLAEKVGVLGIVGTFLVALIRVWRWVSNFNVEHELLLKHLQEATPLIERFIAMEEAAKTAKIERAEMLEELRGLRQEINDVLKLMIEGYQRGG